MFAIQNGYDGTWLTGDEQGFTEDLADAEQFETREQAERVVCVLSDLEPRIVPVAECAACGELADENAGGWDEDEPQTMSGPTAYVFRCKSCREMPARCRDAHEQDELAKALGK